MKLDRLIGILSILLQKGAATAPELAECFEVSRRTINRDIETLCCAGIPIVTKQGSGGGISIMENFKLDRTLLTSAEMQDILAGLRGLDSVNGTNRYGQLMEKLSAGSSSLLSGDSSILIDLSSWYQDSLAPKIKLLQDAIASNQEISFSYYSPQGNSLRRIEPYYLIFKWTSWYLWGWCMEKEAFRLFKLNRLDDLKLTGRTFSKHCGALPDLSSEKVFTGGIKVKAVFEPDCKWRLIEEFGNSCFEEQADGSLFFQAEYTNKDYLLSWLLSFGDKVTLLAPEELQLALLNLLKKMKERYSI